MSRSQSARLLWKTPWVLAVTVKHQGHLFSASVGFPNAPFGSWHVIQCHVWFHSPLQAEQGHFPRLIIWFNGSNSLLQNVNTCLYCRRSDMLSSRQQEKSMIKISIHSSSIKTHSVNMCLCCFCPIYHLQNSPSLTRMSRSAETFCRIPTPPYQSCSLCSGSGSPRFRRTLTSLATRWCQQAFFTVHAVWYAWIKLY